MFEEVLISRDVDPATLDAELLDGAYLNKLKNELGATCNLWIVRTDNNEVVASGGVTMVSMVPVPEDCSCTVAYIHSIFTETEFRNHGLAEQIMETISQFCKERGVKRLILNASDAGMPLYEKIGFEPATNSMRMFLK
jgi:GNAT superfamily N-acetyltransferase